MSWASSNTMRKHVLLSLGPLQVCRETKVFREARVYECDMWWQPVAKGNQAFTNLSAAGVWGQTDMHSVQPRQLGNGLLLGMLHEEVFKHILLLAERRIG